MKDNYNYELQYYKGIPLKLIKRKYTGYKAKRFTINKTNQNIWIPNVYLESDGTIKSKANLDFIFKTKQAKRKLELANFKAI